MSLFEQDIVSIYPPNKEWVQNLLVLRLQGSWHGGCYNDFQDQPGRRGIGFTILGEGVNLGTTGLFLLFLLNGGAVRRALFDARRQHGLKKWRLRFARDNRGFDFREARFFEHALEFDFRKTQPHMPVEFFSWLVGVA